MQYMIRSLYFLTISLTEFPFFSSSASLSFSSIFSLLDISRLLLHLTYEFYNTTFSVAMGNDLMYYISCFVKTGQWTLCNKPVCP